jgi:NAD(P)-dependent dehydrogenase (short-subunit alcohol dehydrogenase family)
MSVVRGKVAVVTGAGSGIGRALAIELASRGARLALSDVNEAALAETVSALSRIGGAAVYAAPLDVGDRASVRAYAASVLEHYGVAHQLYNNAGIAGFGPILETTYEDYERVLRVNLWGVIHGTKEFLPHLVASEDGHLVNISSLNGFMGQAGLSAYCASKFAVRGFTESVRVEMMLAGHRMRVSVVHPGGVKTNIASAALSAAAALRPERAAREAKRAKVYNEKLFKTSAEQAAKTIVNGVESNKERILVGSDATMADVAVRLLPSIYPRLAAAWERRMFG